LQGHALTNPASPNANGKPSDKLEIPSVTDTMEQSQSKTCKNPSDKEKQKKRKNYLELTKIHPLVKTFGALPSPINVTCSCKLLAPENQ
jgi:hypothetical protein